MSLYQLLIFDLDGTLLDSKMDIANSTNYVRNALGKESLSPDLIRQFVGGGVTELLEKAFSTKEKSVIEKAAKMFRDHYLEHCLDESRWYPGVEDVLKQLKQNHHLTICTNKPKPYADKILTSLNGENYFSAVISGRNGFEQKPDPAGTFSLLEQFKIQPEKALFIGDSEVDIDTAKNAGIDMAFINWGFGTDPHRVSRYNLETIEDLLHIVNS